MTEKLWPLEADPDDPNVPHATVKCANCSMHIFVAKDHPLLPDGPFFCPDHSDTPPTFEKVPDATEAILICDRCGAELAAKAPTREEALAKLWEMTSTAKWDSAFNGAESDLCVTCKTT